MGEHSDLNAVSVFGQYVGGGSFLADSYGGDSQVFFDGGIEVEGDNGFVVGNCGQVLGQVDGEVVAGQSFIGAFFEVAEAVVGATDYFTRWAADGDLGLVVEVFFLCYSNSGYDVAVTAVSAKEYGVLGGIGACFAGGGDRW